MDPGARCMVNYSTKPTLFKLLEICSGGPLIFMGSPPVGLKIWAPRQIIGFSGAIPDTLLEHALKLEELVDVAGKSLGGHPNTGGGFHGSPYSRSLVFLVYTLDPQATKDSLRVRSCKSIRAIAALWRKFGLTVGWKRATRVDKWQRRFSLQ